MSVTFESNYTDKLKICYSFSSSKDSCEQLLRDNGKLPVTEFHLLIFCYGKCHLSTCDRCGSFVSLSTDEIIGKAVSSMKAKNIPYAAIFTGLQPSRVGKHFLLTSCNYWTINQDPSITANIKICN